MISNKLKGMKKELVRASITHYTFDNGCKISVTEKQSGHTWRLTTPYGKVDSKTPWTSEQMTELLDLLENGGLKHIEEFYHFPSYAYFNDELPESTAIIVLSKMILEDPNLGATNVYWKVGIYDIQASVKQLYFDYGFYTYTKADIPRLSEISNCPCEEQLYQKAHALGYSAILLQL